MRPLESDILCVPQVSPNMLLARIGTTNREVHMTSIRTSPWPECVQPHAMMLRLLPVRHDPLARFALGSGLQTDFCRTASRFHQLPYRTPTPSRCHVSHRRRSRLACSPCQFRYTTRVDMTELRNVIADAMVWMGAGCALLGTVYTLVAVYLDHLDNRDRNSGST